MSYLPLQQRTYDKEGPVQAARYHALVSAKKTPLAKRDGLPSRWTICVLVLVTANILALAFAALAFKTLYHDLETGLEATDTRDLPRPDACGISSDMRRSGGHGRKREHAVS